MDIAIVVIAWVAVWGMGASLVVALSAPATLVSPGGAAWVKGAGFLLGAFILTLWMRALSAAHVAFGLVAVALPLLLLAAGALWLAHRRGGLRRAALYRALVEATYARELTGWQRGAWFAIVAWLVLRFALLFIDVVLQPLYPWDAWIQWATKAHVWYAQGRMVPFVDLGPWLAANGTLYTDASPGYPATVPLWQVFSCIVLGRYDDVLMNIPWWMLGVAFPIALYGALRRLAFGALPALAGAAIIATIPLIDVHVALAGYADFPMAAYFTLAALALLRAFATRSRGDIMLALVLAVACPTIKTPGIVWLVTLAAPAIVIVAPRFGTRVVLAGFALALVALLVLAQTSSIVLGYRLHLDFAPPWAALFDSLFMLGTWNILWYGVLAAAILSARQWLVPAVAPMTMLVGSGVLFLFFVFAFTNARGWVESQTTINRAVLHLAPLLAVWAMLALRAWSARDAAHEPPAVVAEGLPSPST